MVLVIFPGHLFTLGEFLGQSVVGVLGQPSDLLLTHVITPVIDTAAHRRRLVRDRRPFCAIVPVTRHFGYPNRLGSLSQPHHRKADLAAGGSAVVAARYPLRAWTPACV